MHQPIVRSTFQQWGQHDEALDAFGPGDDAQGEPEAFAGPVHEVAGVAAAAAADGGGSLD